MRPSNQCDTAYGCAEGADGGLAKKVEELQLGLEVERKRAENREKDLEAERKRAENREKDLEAERKRAEKLQRQNTLGGFQRFLLVLACRSI